MEYSRKLLGPTVSSAVALIIVTNYCIFSVVGSRGSASDVLAAILPMTVPTTIAVILVMSILYHMLHEVLGQLDQRGNELLAKAQRDPLTGSASREFFEERLGHAVNLFDHSRDKFAVIMLDLDHFKRVNDLHGHQTGDELLKMTAQTLRSQVRAGDLVGRFGGDEFLILQRGISSAAEVRRLCARICSELQAPYDLGSLQLRIPTSVGAVISNKRMKRAEDYVRAADMALYDAKRAGRSCFRFFSDVLDEQLRRRDVLERDLRQALESGSDIEVHFQPQICVAGSVCGAEALFRWKHPELGDVPAAEAIEIAEESALIEDIGDFVFRQAAQLAREYPHLSIAMNISPAQFSRSGNIAAKMHDLAVEERISPTQVEFEITERLFMDVGNGSNSQIQGLRSFGFRVALDDFGTGYSSLSYLKRFRVDRLKLDKSFFTASDLQENVPVIRAAVSLAHLLGLDVIAEGIETKGQEAIALESGCDLLQGHRYGAAMNAAAFRRLMTSQSVRSAA